MPLDPKLNKFSTASQIQAVYNFTDIIDGVGKATFWAATHKETTTEAPYLTSQTIKSKSTSYSVAVGSGDVNTTVIDLDFDSKMNTSRIILGDVNVIGVMGLWATITVKIRKWDGTTETEIASASSQEENLRIPGSTGTAPSKTFNILIPVTTPTTIGAGQTLRVTILVELGGSVGVGGQNVGFGIDPANREDILNIQDPDKKIIEDDFDTTLQINVPFQIQ